MPGATISQYQILEELGEGGMRVVHKARVTRLNRLLTLEVVLRDKATDAGRRQCFMLEARAAGQGRVQHGRADRQRLDGSVGEVIPL